MSTPNYVADRIYSAVQEAILANWTVEKFRQECAECWREVLRQEQESAAREWAKK